MGEYADITSYEEEILQSIATTADAYLSAKRVYEDARNTYLAFGGDVRFEDNITVSQRTMGEFEADLKSLLDKWFCRSEGKDGRKQAG